jgi:hypothetical protein
MTVEQRVEQPAAPANTRRSRTPAIVALVVVSYLVLAFLLFEPAWRSPTSVTIGHSQDRGLFMFFLRWTQYAVYHGHSPFFTTHLNYPAGVNTLWNTSEILPGLIFAPVTQAFGAAVTFNLLTTLGVGLSGAAAAFAIKRFVDSWWAAWFGGLIYAFSPFMQAQARGHLHTVLAMLPPLIVLIVHEIAVRQRWHPMAIGAVLGVTLTAQLLIGEELLAITGLIVAALLAYLAIFHRRDVRARIPYILRAGSTAVAVFLVTAAWPLYAQFFGPQRVQHVIQPPDTYASDLLGFFIPTEFQWLAPRWAVSHSNQFSGGGTEHMAYLGIPLIAFLIWTIVRQWRRPVVRAATIVGLVMALLSMGVHLHVDGHKYGVLLPWAIGAVVPVLNNIVASRLILGVFLMAALLLAVGIDVVLKPGGWRARAIAAVVVGLVFVPLFPRLPYPTSPIQRSTFFSSAEAARLIPAEAVVLELPVAFGPRNGDAPTIWHEEAADRFKRPGGYFLGPHAQGASGELVTTFNRIDERLSLGKPVAFPDAEERSEILSQLHEAKIQFVVVGPAPIQLDLVEYVQSLLGPSQRVLDSYIWRVSV